MNAETPDKDQPIIPGDAEKVEGVDPVDGGVDRGAAKAHKAATDDHEKFSGKVLTEGEVVARDEVTKLTAAERRLREEAGIPPKDDTLPESTTTVLTERGVDLSEFEDRTIGGKSEAAMLADFLKANPDVDAKALLEATGNMFAQMTDEERTSAIGKMTSEEYEAFLKGAKDRLATATDRTTNTYIDPETGKEVTEPNQFDLGSAMDNAGVTGNRAPNSSSSGNTYSGTFEVPSISNAELISKVETLAGNLTPPANVAALKAVVAVESGGDLSATRYEPHHGHKGQDEATSFGAFQIMGFNAQSLGYASATEMKNDFQTRGAEAQVEAFGKFLETRNLTPHIAESRTEPDFHAFAKGYNGAGYAKLNYHGKMEAAYRRFASEG